MLIINDFSPFAKMTEGEFYNYFKDKCSGDTPIKKIYKQEKKKLKSVRVDKRANKQRKKAESDTVTD